VVTLNMDTGQKRLELMHELLPAATTIGLLLSPTNAVASTASAQSKWVAAFVRYSSTPSLMLRQWIRHEEPGRASGLL
jgi:hypothetical protein